MIIQSWSNGEKKYVIWIILIWVIIITISFTWNCILVISNNQYVILKKSHAFFDQLLFTRSWNARHGGVYMPVTPETQPNPYLEDPLRDLTTTEGLKLTKI